MWLGRPIPEWASVFANMGSPRMGRNIYELLEGIFINLVPNNLAVNIILVTNTTSLCIRATDGVL